MSGDSAVAIDLEAQGFRHPQARPIDEFDETGEARRVQALAQRSLNVEPLTRAVAIRRSTSAMLMSLGRGRDRRGPSTASVGSVGVYPSA